MKDQGYKQIAKADTFTHDECVAMQRQVWDAYGAIAFTAPNGNMIQDLVNLAAEKAIAKKEKP